MDIKIKRGFNSKELIVNVPMNHSWGKRGE